MYYKPDEADGFCLRVMQDQYLYNGADWIDEWRYLVRAADYFNTPYIYDMYMQEKAERRLTFLVGARYKSGLVLDYLTGHGPHHASMLRKKITRMSGL
jgi:hypothetical protein